MILPSIDLASVEAVTEIWRHHAALRPARRGSQVHLGVASRQESRVRAQVQLEELPVGADPVVGPERRGLQSLRAALPPAEVVALREHFAKLVDPRGGHHFVGDQRPYQGFYNQRNMATELPLRVSNSTTPNFNQTPRRRDECTQAGESARTHIHTHVLGFPTSRTYSDLPKQRP